MFIKYLSDDGRELLIEQVNQPIVYLDNWALNDISLNSSFRKRFINMMNERKGTLRLSASNIVELLNQADQNQIDSILSLIDSIDVGFINTDFVEVINCENRILCRDLRDNPSQKIDLIYAYLLAKNWPEVWTISEVIRNYIKTNSGKYFRKSWDQFSQEMELFLDSVRSNYEYITKSKARSTFILKHGKVFDRPTRELLQLGFDFVWRNSSMTMNSNEWHDFFHTIVPVAYCDLVLLDKRWSSFISQTKLTFPDIAFTFSRKTIDSFFNTLETFDFNGTAI